MDFDDLRRWLWGDPTARPPRHPARTLNAIEHDHVMSVLAEVGHESALVLRRSAQEPVDPEVVPRRVDAPSRCTVPELLARHERVIIVGGRSSGKTALIAHLAACAADDARGGAGAFVPFVVPVRLLPEPALSERTIAQLSPIGGVRLIRRALEERRALVLVDGLDEAGQGTRALSASIQELALAHPGNRVVVTTRPRRTGVPGYARVEWPGFVTATLLPPSGTRVYAAHRFLWRRSPERRAILVAAEVDGLLRGAAREEPEAGSLMASLDLRDRRILFGAVAQQMQWRRIVEIPVGMLADTLRSRLLGAQWKEGQRLILDRSDEDEDAIDEEIERAAERWAAGLPPREEEAPPEIEALARRVVEELRARQGLMIERRAGFFAFADLAYQDYLAAHEEIRLGTTAELIKRRNDPWWHEAIVLAAGAPEMDSAAFIQEILEADRGEAAVATLIASRCAEVAAQELPARLRRTISRRLSELVPPRNEINVAHLLDVGEVAGPALIQSLGSATPSERAFTAIVLGGLGYRPAYGVLMRMASDEAVVEGPVLCPVWKDDVVLMERPVGYFALIALLNMALASRAAWRSFEQALERAPIGVLERFHGFVNERYIIRTVWDLEETDRDPEIIQVLLTKMERVVRRRKGWGRRR